MTPEVSNSHHHETRTLRRQPGGGAPRSQQYREESVDDSMDTVVKLKVPREKFRQLIRSLKNKPKPEPLQAAAVNSHHASRRSQSVTPGQHTPALGSMAPPLTTPGSQPQRISPNRNGQHAGPTGQVPTPHSLLHPHSAAQIGRVDAEGPPSQEHPIVSISP